MRRAALLCGLLLCALLLGGCAARRAQPPPEQVFRYAENQAANHPATHTAQLFADRVYALTEGRVRIHVYAGAALGDEASVVEQLQYGGIDFGRVSLSLLAEHDARLHTLQLPYLYRDSAHMWRVLQGDIGGTFLSYLPDIDLVGLAWLDAGARSIYTQGTRVRSLEDLAGLRIRVQESGMMRDLIALLGAEPVPMRYDEVLPALQTGRIDGAENNFPSYVSTGHYLVAPNIIENEHTRVPEVILASPSAMARLSEADRALVLRAAQEAAVEGRELWYLQQLQSRRIIFAHCRVYRMTMAEKAVFRQAVLPIYDTYAAGMEDVVQAIIQTGPDTERTP